MVKVNLVPVEDLGGSKGWLEMECCPRLKERILLVNHLSSEKYGYDEYEVVRVVHGVVFDEGSGIGRTAEIEVWVKKVKTAKGDLFHQVVSLDLQELSTEKE